MLKINLLPSYYRQRRLVKRALVLVVLAVIATTGGFLYWNSQLQKQIAQINAEIEKYRPTMEKAQSIQAEADAINAMIAPVQAQTGFCDQVVALPEKWVAIIKNAAEYTHASVPLRSLTISGSSLSMQGHTPNLRTAARYLLNALRNPEWTSVQINGPGGYPGQPAGAGLHPRFGPVDYDLQISATLANPVTMPTPGGGGGGGAAGGGMMGAGGPMMGAGMMGGPGSGGMMGPGSGGMMGPGSGGMMGPGSGGMMGPGGPGMMGPGAGGSGGGPKGGAS